MTSMDIINKLVRDETYSAGIQSLARAAYENYLSN